MCYYEKSKCVYFPQGNGVVHILIVYTEFVKDTFCPATGFSDCVLLRVTLIVVLFILPFADLPFVPLSEMTSFDTVCSSFRPTCSFLSSKQGTVIIF